MSYLKAFESTGTGHCASVNLTETGEPAAVDNDGSHGSSRSVAPLPHRVDMRTKLLNWQESVNGTVLGDGERMVVEGQLAIPLST